MFEKFQHFNFQRSSEQVIDQANEILTEYHAQGFVLTLRQLYYQFVARDYIPNTQKSYKRLGEIVNNARLAGRIDWEMIEDRVRNLLDLPNWDDPQSIVDSCARQFRLDIWSHQNYRPEVWIEKDALTGVIEPICQQLRIPYFATRGYNSQSEQWRAGHRIRHYLKERKEVVILHLGDHDPSGLDMSRDNETRLAMFANTSRIRFKRIALNMDQVDQYDPPPNPAKSTDSRFDAYVDEFGDESWELDALEPRVIVDLIRKEIDPMINTKAWDAVEAEENEIRETFNQISAKWSDVSHYADAI